MLDHLVTLSESDLFCLLKALQSERLRNPYSDLSVQRLIASPQFKGVARELRALADRGFSSEQIAFLVEMLLTERRHASASSSIVDLVTTGPEVGGVTNRDTRIVVRELFATAEHTVLLSGYAVYQGQIVFEALANRMEELPTLQVRLFLDVHRPSGDSREPQVLVERFRTQFLKYQWPLNKPIPEVFYYPSSLELDSSKRSVLHAKCIVVDENHVFVSSANFTEAAQERNIEIGLAFKSPEIAKRIIWHFSALLDEGILVPLFNVR